MPAMNPDSSRIAAYDAAMAAAYANVTMLRAAWRLADARESRGQLLRLSLVPLGHLFGRLPLGNTGRSNVNAFAPMDVPVDLKRLLDDGRG